MRDMVRESDVATVTYEGKVDLTFTSSFGVAQYGATFDSLDASSSPKRIKLSTEPRKMEETESFQPWQATS